MNKNKKIIIVDDENDILEILAKFFSRKKLFYFLTYNNPNEALANLHIDKPNLILTDIMMPEINGMELLKKVKEHNKDIKVMMMTAYSTIDKIQESESLGACDYIIKPFVSLEDVQKRILDNLE